MSSCPSFLFHHILLLPVQKFFFFFFFRMLCNHHNSSSIRVGESGKPGRGSIGRWIPFFVEFVMNLQVVQFYFAPRIWVLQSSPAVG